MSLVKMQVEITRLLIVQVRGRAAKARREGRNEVGASAIEWAIISALVVGLAIVVFGFVKDAIEKKEGDINKEP
ncbi:hypothetical protein MU582_10825 [Nocardioidaceae bacterium SCSIO 66511]|nr:hypothetical protein MU582_10825 [Nocardioidaceae bacterium SCSIO 66511]